MMSTSFQILAHCLLTIVVIIGIKCTFKKRVNLNLPLCIAKHHTMKSYRGMEVHFHAFLTSAQDGGDWTTLRPGGFTPRENDPRHPLDRILN
jgi:hypothetical protein